MRQPSNCTPKKDRGITTRSVMLELYLVENLRRLKYLGVLVG